MCAPEQLAASPARVALKVNNAAKLEGTMTPFLRLLALVLRFSHLIQLICPRIARPAVPSRSKVKHLTDSEH
jgi:hypothetical protein